jgi:hypothetical protein
MKTLLIATATAFLFLARLPQDSLAQSSIQQTSNNEALPAAIIAKAEIGDAEAQAQLGSMFSDGRGMEKDYVEGYAWLNLAARSDEKSARQRDALELRMTPQQIADAQKRTRELRTAIEARKTQAATNTSTNAVATTNTAIKVIQPNGPVRETYVGGSIFKEEHKRPMKTAIGTRDLFGRKEYAGYTELRFQGITSNGLIILRLTEVDTQSKARTSQISATSNTGKPGYVNGVYVDGKTTIRGTITHPAEELPPNTTEFTFDPTKETELVIAGYRVRFLEFTQQKLKYSYAK